MSESQRDTMAKPARSKLQIGLFFILFAIPGLALFLVFSALLFAVFFDPSSNLPHPIVSAATAVVGLVLILLGVGKLRQWIYSFVFLVIPLALYGYFLVDRGAVGGKLAPGVFAGLVALVTYYVVRRFYGRRGPSN